MSKNTRRMIGIVAMIVSIFLLIGGLYLPQANISSMITSICLASGIALLIVGVVFYKII